MSLLVPRRRRGGGHRRPVAAAAVLVALAATGLVGAGPADAAPSRVAATGGCRAVGSGDAPSGGGPNRATVVVDTGSGPVWSACISFTGTISGIEGLELARSVIPDLNPEYDQYTGLGRAVCKLRGVGTAPPDCLGKSVNSWWLSLNGKITGVGAAGLTVKDGDVEGWRYASGGAPPRAASEGTEAAAAPPPTTTTRPPTPTTQPPVATTKPGGSMTGSTKLDGTPADPTTTRPGETTTTKAGQTTTTKPGETTTSTTGEDGPEDEAAAVAGASEDGGPGDDEVASGSAATDGGATQGLSGSDDSGPLPAALGFAAVIAAIGGGIVLIRKRNAAAGPA